MHVHSVYKVGDIVESEFNYPGNSKTFWCKGTVTGLTKNGLVTTRFDDGETLDMEVKELRFYAPKERIKDIPRSIVMNPDMNVEDPDVMSEDPVTPRLKPGPKVTKTFEWFDERVTHHLLRPDAMKQFATALNIDLINKDGKKEWNHAHCKFCNVNNRKGNVPHTRKFKVSDALCRQIHTDISPFYTTSLQGNKYCICFSDPISHYSYLVAVPDRSGKSAIYALRRFLIEVIERANASRTNNDISIQLVVKVLIGDGEKAFGSKEFKRFCDSKDIDLLMIPPDHPNLNAPVEHKIYVYDCSIRSLLFRANFYTKFHLRFWEFASIYSVMIVNARLLKSNNFKSAYERVFGVPYKPLQYIPPFGALCDVYEPKSTRKKETFQLKYIPCWFLCFDPNGRPADTVGIFYNPATGKLRRCSDFTELRDSDGNPIFRSPEPTDEVVDDDSKFGTHLELKGFEFEDSDASPLEEYNQAIDIFPRDLFEGPIDPYLSEPLKSNTSDDDDDYILGEDIQIILPEYTADSIRQVSSLSAHDVENEVNLVSKYSHYGQFNELNFFDVGSVVPIQITDSKASDYGHVYQVRRNSLPCADLIDHGLSELECKEVNGCLSQKECICIPVPPEPPPIFNVPPVIAVDTSADSMFMRSLDHEINRATVEATTSEPRSFYYSNFGGEASNDKFEPEELGTKFTDTSHLPSYEELIEMRGKLLNRAKIAMSRQDVKVFERLLDVNLQIEPEVIVDLFNVFSVENMKGTNIPNSFKELLKMENSDVKRGFIEAHKLELQQLVNNETWEYVPRPEGKNVIGSRFIYTVKYKADGTISRFKARFVCKGFTQIHGIDYFDTYAPVVGMISLKMVMALATSRGWKVLQLDVETAFLNSPVDEEIYVELPEGLNLIGVNLMGVDRECFWQQDPYQKMVIKLKKSLYGLKQAPANWNQTLKAFMSKHGYISSPYDDCLLKRYNKETGKYVSVAIYVDDIVVTGSDEEGINELRSALSTEYKIKDSGESGILLGIIVDYDPLTGNRKLHQKLFVEKLCETYLSPDDKTIRSTPADPDTYSKYPEYLKKNNEPILTTFPYRQAIGSLLYLAVMTRPDISNIVRYLSKFVNCYTQLHVDLLYRVLHYLRGSANIGLVLKKDTTEELVGYSDASYADDPFNSRSTIAYVITYCGVPVAHRSEQTTFVCDSSTKAEYAAIHKCVLALMHCRKIFEDITFNESGSITIYNNSPDRHSTALEDFEQVKKFGLPLNVMVDNQAAIWIGMTDSTNRKHKHLNVRFDSVREEVCAGNIVLKYIHTSEQLADILTKCLGKSDFLKFRDQLLG